MTRINELHSAATRTLVVLAVLAGLGAAALTGCASSPPGVTKIPVTANPSDELQALGGELQTARDAQVDLLSPAWFARAQESFRNARRLRDGGGSVASILGQVADGRASLEQARSVAAVSRESLPAVLRAREDARKAGAEALAPYRETEASFLELTRSIEDDKLSWARRNSGNVEKGYRALELDAIKRNTLERIDDLIAKAENENAAVLVPGVLADTRSRRAELDRFISNNRYAVSAMSTRAAVVLFDANRLVNLTQSAKAAKSGGPEQVALDQEAALQALREILQLPDARNQSLAAQLRSLEVELGQLRRDRDELAERSASQREIIAKLQGENEAERTRVASLEADRRFNALFAEVSDMFGSDEAEVYKKDTSLVIRLRSLQFPVGSTVVLPDSYSLMTKVQTAIRTFGDPQIVIEGHTDSTGSTEINDRISQSRADAVRAYLVANGTAAADHVAAVGKGFSEPLASDRTAEGRAQNRRIDVVIQPIAADRTAQTTPSAPLQGT